MDERKRTIRDLEEKKRQEALNEGAFLEKLGEGFYETYKAGKPGTTGDKKKPPAGVIEAIEKIDKLTEEINESYEVIKKSESDFIRLKEIEKEIAVKEKESGDISSDLSTVMSELGKLVAREPALEEVAAPFTGELDRLASKIDEKEKTIADLSSPGEGFLTSISSGVRAAVMKPFLAKNRADLERIYKELGEKYLSGDIRGTAETLSAVEDKASSLREKARNTSADISSLKDEKSGLIESSGHSGDHMRKINGLEKHIERVRLDIACEYRAAGGIVTDGSLTAAQRKAYASYIPADAEELVEKIRRSREIQKSFSDKIEKLKTQIEIDEEKENVRRLEEAVEKEKRIAAAAEDAIKDFKSQIECAENHIKELNKKL